MLALRSPVLADTNDAQRRLQVFGLIDKREAR
jgi:hypothetical protein